MNLKRLSILYLVILLAHSGCAAQMNTSSSPQGSGGGMSWVRYTDSAEGAFSIEVPLGWQVLGGMYRMGFLDVRWMIDVRSLDGKVILRINDPNIPPYALPGPHTGSAGHAAIRPQIYQMVVDNYRQAQPFAESYAKSRFSAVCKSMSPRQNDWTPTMPAGWRSESSAKVTEGTVAFDCATADGPRVAIVYARNVLHPGSGLWQAEPIISLIATPDKVAQAQAMMQHMIDSWQENPDWAHFQQQMTNKGLEQMGADFRQFLQQMQVYHQQREAAMNQQVAHFESQQHSQAQQVSSWGETLTGLTTVRDSATGTEFQVFSGPKANYYTNGNGVTVNSNLSPGAGFHAVTSSAQ
jgi:hypothetical protein